MNDISESYTSLYAADRVPIAWVVDPKTISVVEGDSVQVGSVDTVVRTDGDVVVLP